MEHIRDAVSNGDLDLFKYLYANLYENKRRLLNSNYFCNHVVAKDDLVLLKYLHENEERRLSHSFLEPIDLYNLVVAKGHIECLKYLNERYSYYLGPSNKKLCSLAAAYGHIECIKYLRENRC